MTGSFEYSRNPVDPGAQRERYLSEADSEKIFRRIIVPSLDAHGERREQPVAVVLSAQPGAGKSSATRKLLADFSFAGDAVAVDVDGFKEFYPQVAQLRRDLGEVVADELIHADARRWLEKSLDYLVGERRVNVVVEHGLRNAEVTNQLLARFADAGYRVQAALLTTPAAVSMQGILLRYQTGHEQGGGRDIDPELHAQRYQGLLEIADRLFNDPRVESIRLFRRDGTLVHRAGGSRGQHSGSPMSISPREALETERSRIWTVEETRAFLDTHRHLVARMEPTWRPRIEAALSAARPLLSPGAASGTSGHPSGAPGPVSRRSGRDMSRRGGFGRRPDGPSRGR